MDLGAEDRRTLRFAPLWVLSALAGTGNRFGTDELGAFWDAVVQVALRTPEPARALLTALADDRPGLLRDFARDQRSVVTGLSDVVATLDRAGSSSVSADYRLALLRVGTAQGRARGPYGRQLTGEDTQLLLLVAQLLGIESAPPRGDDVLV